MHEDEVATGVALYTIEVLRALWPHLDTDDKRALRLSCTVMRDAVDAQTDCVEEPPWGPWATVLTQVACARLSGVHTLTLRSMACLRDMLVEPPEPCVVFPRLQSLRLILAQGGMTLEDPADFHAIARATPFLTQLRIIPPARSTALPQQMAELLSQCSKLEDLALHAYESQLVDITALAAGTQLQRLELRNFLAVSHVMPLATMANLQSLNMSQCSHVSSLSPLGAMVKLQSLNLTHCSRVSDLAPLGALVKLQSLDLRHCSRVSDLMPLASMVQLQSLDISGCDSVSDLAPLGALVSLRSLKIGGCMWRDAIGIDVTSGGVSDLSPLASMVQLQSLDMTYCERVSDLAPLASMVSLQTLDMSYCSHVSDLVPLGALVNLQKLKMWKCIAASDLTPLAALVNLQKLNLSMCRIWRRPYQNPNV
ncbi:hypothetical protein FOA52_008337 [Chlamydomonas sp. UWO 241]|nr:hypothetical protein FOA52_008337 [Chlamydomonas sp. UWO 241]